MNYILILLIFLVLMNLCSQYNSITYIEMKALTNSNLKWYTVSNVCKKCKTCCEISKYCNISQNMKEKMETNDSIRGME
jgi:hypothetical protein